MLIDIRYMRSSRRDDGELGCCKPDIIDARIKRDILLTASHVVKWRLKFSARAEVVSERGRIDSYAQGERSVLYTISGRDYGGNNAMKAKFHRPRLQ